MALKSSKKHKKIERLINSLTHNEDIKQDLWVEYLAGADMKTILFKAHQHGIKYKNWLQSNSSFICDLLYNPPEEDFIQNFNDQERELMCLFALGYNVGEVCVHLGTTRVQVEHLLSSIRGKNTWSKVWLQLKRLEEEKPRIKESTTAAIKSEC
jgi:hypothetical protein